MKKRNLIMLAALFTFTIGFASVHAKNNSEIKNEDLDLFTTIEANVDTSDIKIIKGDKCKIEINYRRPEEKISYNVKNNTLMITGKRSWNIFSLFGSKKYNVITVYAPQIDSAKLNARSGDIVVDSFETNDLSINATSGDIKIKDTSAKTATINTTSGDIKLENFDTQKVTANVTSGDVEIKISKIQDANVNTLSGDIKISDVQMKNANVNTLSGNINIDSTEQSNLNLKSGSGTIKVDGKSYEREYTESNSYKNNINAEVSSGDIRITHK